MVTSVMSPRVHLSIGVFEFVADLCKQNNLETISFLVLSCYSLA